MQLQPCNAPNRTLFDSFFDEPFVLTTFFFDADSSKGGPTDNVLAQRRRVVTVVGSNGCKKQRCLRERVPKQDVVRLVCNVGASDERVEFPPDLLRPRVGIVLARNN